MNFDSSMTEEKKLRDKSVNDNKVGLRNNAGLKSQDLLLCVSQTITHSTNHRQYPLLLADV